MTRAFFFVTSFLTVIAVSLSVGCSGGDEELPEPGSRPTPESAAEPVPAPPAPADTPAPTPTRSPEERAAAAASIAEQLSEKIDLPSYYPEDGPVYPGARPSQAKQAPSGRVSLVFGTDASPDEASKVMTEASEAKGWTIDSDDVIERGHLTRASKDGRALMILTNRLDGGGGDATTIVAVSVDP